MDDDLDGLEVVEVHSWGNISPVRHLVLPSSNAADYGSPFEPCEVLVARAERLAEKLWHLERPRRSLRSS